MYLVIGAAGSHAGAVTRALARKGSAVRAFVRDERAAQRARAYGASQIAFGDLHDIPSIEAAARDMAGVFHIGPRYMADEAQVGRAVIAAAERAGVEKFVYSSALHAIASRMLNHDAKRVVEETLIQTKLAYTILQPARFMQGLLMGWPAVQAHGVWAEPFSAESKISYVDYEDVAEVAAIALTEPGYTHATFELSAEGMLDRHQQAAILGEVLGRPIRAGVSSLEELARFAPEINREPYLREGLSRMFDYYDTVGFTGGNSLVLRTLLRRPPTDYRTFVQRFVSQMSGARG
jgi:uncharacterized protein YbjT (DUF2867 family)